MIGVLFYKLGAFFAHYLPPRLSVFIARHLASIQFHMRFRVRRLVMENLRIVVGRDVEPDVLRQKSRKVFDNFARSIYLFLRLPYTDIGCLRDRCDFNGFDKLTADLGGRGGFIIVAAHLGPWEVGGACLSAAGLKINTVALNHPSVRVTRFFEERRRLLGIRTHPLKDSLRVLREALNEGECVVLLIDRAYGTGHKVFRWFGRDMEMPVGHLALALRCGVPIVVASCVFGDDSRLRYVFSGPYYPDKSKDEEAAMNQLQRQCIEALEGTIREYPEQWFNFTRLGAA